jgi:hypothetical protein
MVKVKTSAIGVGPNTTSRKITEPQSGMVRNTERGIFPHKREGMVPNTTIQRGPDSKIEVFSDSEFKTEGATKRIPVTPTTWADLHDLRQAGESYDTMLQRIMKEAGTYRMIRDMDAIENEGDFIPLEDMDMED